MYLGVDIGGTKTLVAVLDKNGVIKEDFKFPTPKDYQNFLLELRHCVHHLKTQDFKAACVAVPGLLDREHGRVIGLGNLDWKNKPIQADCERIVNCPTIIENDANLAGLSEAMLHPDYQKVLYVTVSTGIGIGFVEDRHLDESMLDAEGGKVMLPYKDKLIPWEKFGSGKAFYKHFGKRLVDIPASDTAAWNYIARQLAAGLFDNIALFQPDLIVMGGGVGAHLEHFKKPLMERLERFSTPVVDIPKLVKAQRPETAVVYGCYDLVKQHFSHGKINK